MSAPSIGAGAPAVVRKCAPCEEEDKVGSTALQRDGAARADFLAGAAAPAGVTDVLREPGNALDPATRNLMEAGFGVDFGDVRVHDDARAAASARDVAARAYTVGNHIAFDRGAYRPGDPQGRRLLAHELAHVVQQNGGARHVAAPTLRRDFELTLSICNRVLNSRSFDVSSGNVSLTVNASLGQSGDPGKSEDGAARPCGGSYYYLSLEKEGAVYDSEIGTQPAPYGAPVARNWTGLAAGKYHLVIWTNDAHDDCCLDGQIAVQTPAAAPAAAAPAMSGDACFDGDKFYVNKGGKTASCAALTGSIGEPTPPGAYCIRHQGEAQTAGRQGRLHLQDRPHWFLLEPQFATTRSRMMLHPGTMSSGCITVMDRGCFDQMAAVLEAGATSSAVGYDGYPPGNAEKVQNAARDVTCVGKLTVSGQIGSCGAANPAGAAQTPMVTPAWRPRFRPPRPSRSFPVHR